MHLSFTFIFFLSFFLSSILSFFSYLTRLQVSFTREAGREGEREKGRFLSRFLFPFAQRESLSSLWQLYFHREMYKCTSIILHVHYAALCLVLIVCIFIVTRSLNHSKSHFQWDVSASVMCVCVGGGHRNKGQHKTRQRERERESKKTYKREPLVFVNEHRRSSDAPFVARTISFHPFSGFVLFPPSPSSSSSLHLREWWQWTFCRYSVARYATSQLSIVYHCYYAEGVQCFLREIASRVKVALLVTA